MFWSPFRSECFSYLDVQGLGIVTYTISAVLNMLACGQCAGKVNQVSVICNLMTICYAEVDVAENEMNRVVSVRDAERSNANGYTLDKIPSDGMKRDSMLVHFNFCWIKKIVFVGVYLSKEIEVNRIYVLEFAQIMQFT